MKKKRLAVKDQKLRTELKSRSREDFRKDFFELLKRASKTTVFRS